jgi:mannose-6-phosphate isomerase-like protein (cupin superfamily)
MDKTHRPWGWYENLYDNSKTYKVKRLFVSPNQRISLQYHNNRSEHWVVVGGNGIVNLEDDNIMVDVGDYIFIPFASKHRIQSGNDGIMIIEVQQGSSCDEEDIVRLDDDYNRV